MTTKLLRFLDEIIERDEPMTISEAVNIWTSLIADFSLVKGDLEKRMKANPGDESLKAELTEMEGHYLEIHQVMKEVFEPGGYFEKIGAYDKNGIK